MFRLPEKDLLDALADHEFGHAYLEEQANLRIAAQVRALRLARNWTQEQLAENSGMKQARVSKIESADFESVTLTTLRKLSEAFDVHLKVEFADVASALLDLSNLSKSRLEVSKREDSLNALSRMLENNEIFVGAASTGPVFAPPHPGASGFATFASDESFALAA
ncbi:helix-turn-helix transcriptional regulator [Caballeronia sp. dw_19]|uniref:helix-turn-helix domain-containing protein n=1 Tax=Caballeronia sp. dw_19 TaxID=2719791 RepID=UPI001BD07AE3|nr:helix-turn-helix transcriptional regulator [Caballeronia sp. dw_19]